MKNNLIYNYYHARYNILDKILYLESNQYCCSCGKISGIIPLCKNCTKKLVPDFSSLRCSNCGKLLISEDSICTDCRENPVISNLDKIFPLYSYRLWKKELLFKWKIEGQRNLVFFFALQIFSVYNRYFSNIPIVPIPPRPGKIRKNGWDQVNDLTLYLKKIYKINILPLLERVEITQQKKLSRMQRLEHRGKSYVLSKKSKKMKIPESVVLIDDILTTGVTLDSCAQILKEWGVKKVYAITLFIAD
ncbi:MAG: ComF family protein [Treponemataceae bacterium]